MKNKKSFAFILIFLFTITNMLRAQNTDSLLRIMSVKGNEKRPELLNALATSVLVQDNNLALKYAQLGLKYAAEQKNQDEETKALSIIGKLYYFKGDYDKSLEYFQILQNKSIEYNDLKKLSGAYNGIGVVYKAWGKYDKAQEYYFKALRIFEQQKNEIATAPILMNIGCVYRLLKRYKLSLEFFEKSLLIYQKSNDLIGISDIKNNVGLTLSEMKQYAQASVAYKEGIELSEKLGDIQGLAKVYNNVGDLYLSWQKPLEAIQYYEKSIQYEQKSENSYGVIISEYSIGNAYYEMKNYTKALEYAEKCLDFVQENKFAELEIDILELIYKSKIELKKFEEATEIMQQFINKKDSLSNKETNKTIFELQTKYDTEKKKREIELLKKQQEVMTISAKIQSVIKYFLIAILCLFVILIFVILKAYRHKKETNIALTSKNEELQQQKEEIASQRDLLVEMNEALQQQKEEITSQRDEIEIQRDEIISQKNDIQDSIVYAQKIQQALLPSEDILKNNVKEHFIIYQPKDVVSGDFYWYSKIKNYLIVAVADCTGHGVPGAFMSMLGISFLNEIVKRDEVTQANHVLNLLREHVIQSLSQKGFYSDQLDGMDISLCAINLQTLEMQFAGANNPCYVITRRCAEPVEANESKQSEAHETRDCFTGVRNDGLGLIELKGDKMPIAYFIKMDNFSNQTYKLQNGDTLYMFTDGIIDQFGGPKGKKFYASSLKDLLTSSVQHSLPIQKNIIETTIEAWKNPLKSSLSKFDQTDDICILGIRI